VSDRLSRFVKNFGKPPEGEPREIIPKRWRMPVFVGMIIVGILGLALVWYLLVSPAIGQ
jgi:hypothetical protein